MTTLPKVAFVALRNRVPDKQTRMLRNISYQKEKIDPQNTGISSPGYNAAALLDHAANGVILGTYGELDQKAVALQATVTALTAAPTPMALAAAR